MDYRQTIVQWREFPIPAVLPRQQNINLTLDFIHTISGPRRAGKTYFCFQLIHGLLQQGISRENILYINFEDNRLLGATAADLDALDEAFREISKINHKQGIYLFLDEIQVVQDWDAWVRKTYDLQRNVHLVITGSSSTLLSREISTKLRGRVLTTEIFPLRFQEVLQWNGITYNLKTISHSKEKAAIKNFFRKYLAKGGYPVLFTQKQVPEEALLQSYYDTMIFKDIIERHKIEDVKKLKSLALLLFQSVSCEISYNKLANKLQAAGFAISKNTVIEYLHHFEDAYLFFQNVKYEYSLAKQLGSIKKLYCIDNGLLNAINFKFSEERGKLLENLVFIELKQKSHAVYYHHKKQECDFLVVNKNKVIAAIQVTSTLNEENERREINGILEALTEHKLKEGLILTEDQEETRVEGEKTIKIMPVWKWLLNDSS